MASWFGVRVVFVLFLEDELKEIKKKLIKLIEMIEMIEIIEMTLIGICHAWRGWDGFSLNRKSPLLSRPFLYTSSQIPSSSEPCRHHGLDARLPEQHLAMSGRC